MEPHPVNLRSGTHRDCSSHRNSIFHHSIDTACDGMLLLWNIGIVHHDLVKVSVPDVPDDAVEETKLASSCLADLCAISAMVRRTVTAKEGDSRCKRGKENKKAKSSRHL